MVLTPDQKRERKRKELLTNSEKLRPHIYRNRFVAPIFQKMIRAEAAAMPATCVLAMVDGQLDGVFRRVGECVCVTCGAVHPWKGARRMNAGHFLSSRCNSIIFEQDGVAPQCALCNLYRDGEQNLYRAWMLAVRGAETIERLERLKATTRQFTREELVNLRMEFQDRLDAAEEQMRG